jgi:ribosomal protein S18 acetylase RimI-like enzyme
MIKFDASYELLVETAPAFGRAAVLPWDAELFGFNVGTFQPADPTNIAGLAAADLRAALLGWMRKRDVELLSCSVPAGAFQSLSVLAQLGFVFVDLGLTAFARKLTGLPAASLEVRRAGPADTAALEAIAGSTFRFGRYHADARFPKPLADHRYRRWLGRAVGAQSDTEFVLVSGPVGQPTGFVHATLERGLVDIRLIAVSEHAKGRALGPALLGAALQHLMPQGAREVKARLSGGNTAALNLYSRLGLSFREADAIYHLHAPGAPHLLPPVP